MRLSIEDIDVEKFIQLDKEQDEIYNIKREYEKQVAEQLAAYDKQAKKLEKQMIGVFCRGYWWSYDVDKSWRYPKKYSIKRVYFYGRNDFLITVKEVVKKKPYPGFKGEYTFDLEEFCKINIYETEEEAKQLYPKRTCPRCGKAIGFIQTELCRECIAKLQHEIEEFEKSHIFYHAPEGRVYQVRYENSGRKGRYRGFSGKHFVLRRLDTGEIIETTDLMSCGFRENIDNLPEIEFIEDVPSSKFVSDCFKR